MRRILVITCCCALLVAGTVRAEMLKEPTTGVEFLSSLQLPKGTVSCTGVDVREKWFVKVYAIAHYAAPDAWPKSDKPVERLDHWVNTPALKAFVLKMTYNAGQKKLRDAWKEGLDNAGYNGPNRDALLAAFKQDIKKDDEIRFIADPDGTLLIDLNKTPLGSWKDPDLVKAMWTIWMGKDSVLNNRENLVKIPAK